MTPTQRNAMEMAIASLLEGNQPVRPRLTARRLSAIQALRAALAEDDADMAKVHVTYTCILCGTSDSPCKHSRSDRKAEPDEYTVEVNGRRSAVLTAMMNSRTKAEPVSDEPVAWATFNEDGEIIYIWSPDMGEDIFPRPHKDAKPLYTHPQKREPLMDAEIGFLWEERTGHSIFGIDGHEGLQMFVAPDEIIEFVRAIECAHGIGGDE